MTIRQSNYIKLIAIITMFIDHAGIILFPNLLMLRIIGRISFPLFAYQLGEGYEHTRSIKKYISRLFLFGAILQLLYSLSILVFKINVNYSDLNIFFTLSFGLAAIHFYNKKSYFSLMLTIIIPMVLDFYKINLDYGLFGVVLILIIYIKRDNLLQFIILMAIISIVYDFYLKENNKIEIFSLLSVIFIIKPKSLQFNIPKYFFYIFYPLHLVLLYSIRVVIK